MPLTASFQRQDIARNSNSTHHAHPPRLQLAPFFGRLKDRDALPLRNRPRRYTESPTPRCAERRASGATRPQYRLRLTAQNGDGFVAPSRTEGVEFPASRLLDAATARRAAGPVESGAHLLRGSVDRSMTSFTRRRLPKLRFLPLDTNRTLASGRQELLHGLTHERKAHFRAFGEFSHTPHDRIRNFSLIGRRIRRVMRDEIAIVHKSENTNLKVPVHSD